jgi:hypothetical protein
MQVKFDFECKTGQMVAIQPQTSAVPGEDTGMKQATAKQSQRGATSYDVARQAGVSQSAVSRCFKQGASVAPRTREKIMLAAQALGYHPNAIAQGLITRRSNLVAIIISNLTNLYYPVCPCSRIGR